jgi:diaminopimelate epimerase
LTFSKWTALGNTFIVIPVATDPKARMLDAVKRVCDPALGLAADGVGFVNTRTKRLHIYNADGGRAEISGNGARCAAAWWFRCYKPGTREIEWMTDTGKVSCKKTAGNAIAVTMPPPRFDAEDVPVRANGRELDNLKIPAGLKSQSVIVAHVLSLGNPQAVVWVRRFPAEWRELGRVIEHHRMFPQRTNVVFARRSRTGIDIRIWERGAGETPSSGTGAAAAAISAATKGIAGRNIKVKMQGGEMTVKWLASGEIQTACAVTEIAFGELAYAMPLK